MKLWKALGLAGLAGVAATGVIIARNERRRAQMTPEEIRARLQQRLADADERPEQQTAPPVATVPAGHRWSVCRRRRRRLR